MLIPESIKFADGTVITAGDVITLEKVDHFQRNNFTTYCARVALKGRLKRLGITKEEYEHLRSLLKGVS